MKRVISIEAKPVGVKLIYQFPTDGMLKLDADKAKADYDKIKKVLTQL